MYGQQVFVRRHGFAWRSEALVYLDASTDSGGYYYGDATLELEPVTRVELVFPEADIPRLEALADGDISSLVWRWVNEAWGCPAGRTPEEVGPREGVIDPTELDYPRLLVGGQTYTIAPTRRDMGYTFTIPDGYTFEYTVSVVDSEHNGSTGIYHAFILIDPAGNDSYILFDRELDLGGEYARHIDDPAHESCNAVFDEFAASMTVTQALGYADLVADGGP